MKIWQKPTSWIKNLLSRIKFLGSFMLMVILYSLKMVFGSLVSVKKDWFLVRFVKFLSVHFDNFYEKTLDFLEKNQQQTISRVYLIELSFRNMLVKKTRTIVTVGGMAISISFIVFLISVGFGLENLVTSRVARLEELEQAEILPGLSEETVLNEAVLARLQNMPQVKASLPLISVVGKISYQDSVSDLAVYGVTSDYLKNSAIQPIQGKIFDSQDIITSSLSKSTKTITTDITGQGQQASDSADAVTFSIKEGAWLRVRSEASTQASVLGYTRKVATAQSGTKVIGDSYAEYAGPAETKTSDSAIWIKAEIPLWENKKCVKTATELPEDNDGTVVDSACEDGQYIPLRDEAKEQVIKEGYTAWLSVISVTKANEPVLGVTNADGTLPIVNLASNSASLPQDSNLKLVEINKNSLKEAVVNKAVLNVIGLAENQAVGKKITLTFVAVGDLVEGESERIESVPTIYTIVAVTPEEDTPVVYVPFIELRSLGINRMSQIKIIVKDKNQLANVRATIEAMGYGTVSVVDTVAQINSLFATFRLVLGIVGMVALAVATLGMFNTLTVSLLERTREVGLMKAMGMKSQEVKELFLTESMIMGFYGGLFGLIIGSGVGKILSLVLSSVAVAKGVGLVDISMIPFTFVVMIMILSTVVGILTGLYPAKRATKISALNALRYE